MPHRRALLGAPALLAAPAAQAQEWPSRPIRVVLPFAPGGSSDLAARLVAPRLSALLGQQVQVDNRAGGGGNIAAELVARSVADGHTLLQGNMGLLAVNPALYPSLPFDVVRSFQPVSHLMSVANILCVPADRPWRTLGELLAALRARPDAIRAGNSGPGSIGHLAVVLFDLTASTRSVHVPYRGGGPMATDLIAGHLDYAFATTPTVLGAIEAGRLRALAVATAARSPQFPNLPTVAEAGMTGFEVPNWDSWLFPRGVPEAAVTRMAAVLRQVLAEPEILAEFTRRGLEPFASSPAALAAAIQAEQRRWAPVVRASGVTPEG